MNNWRWDRLHTVVFPHQPFDNVNALRPWFDREMPNGGDWSTVNVGPFVFDRPIGSDDNEQSPAPTTSRVAANAPQAFQQRAIPSYRQIIDLAEANGGRFIHPLGQSGHILSPHYDDFLADWQAVRYRPMRFDRSAIEADHVSTLRLEPEE